MKEIPQAHSLSELNDNTAFLLLETGRMLRRSFDPKMAELNLSRREWYLISHLCYFNGAPQQQLADILDMTKGGMAKLVARLEQRGFLRRQSASENGKGIKRVLLTEAGYSLAYLVDKESQASVSNMVAQLSSEEQHQFKDMLRRLQSGLENLS